MGASLLPPKRQIELPCRMTKVYTAKLSPEARAAFRAQLVAQIPAWYRPFLHLGVPSLFGLLLMLACALWVWDLRAWQCLIVPLTVLVANATEWRVHKYALHRRLPLAGLL